MATGRERVQMVLSHREADRMALYFGATPDDELADIWNVDVAGVSSQTDMFSHPQKDFVEMPMHIQKWHNRAYFFPIHIDELNKNNLLIQNPLH